MADPSRPPSRSATTRVEHVAQSRRRRRLLALVGGVVALLVVTGVVLGTWWSGRAPDAPSAPTSASPSTVPSPSPAATEPTADVEPMVLAISVDPERRDPGTSRPGYDTVQPVRNVDVTQTVLGLLDLPALDGATSSGWPPLRLR